MINGGKMLSYALNDQRTMKQFELFVLVTLSEPKVRRFSGF